MATADTSMTFYGFWHLEGETVRVSVLGIDMGTAVVQANGSVTVNYAADAGALVTPAYLAANTNVLTGVEQNNSFSVTGTSGTAGTVTVPVVVGIDYTTQGQVLRPDVAVDIHSPLGPGLGKTKRAHWLAAFVQDAIAISFGTDFTTSLTAAKFTTDGVTARAADSPFTGVYTDTLKDGYGFETMLCWQVNRPYACTVCAVATFLDFEER